MLVINQFIIEIDDASNLGKRSTSDIHTDVILREISLRKIKLVLVLSVNHGEMLTELIGQYCQTVPILHKHKPLAPE